MQSSFLINCYLAFYRKGACLELDKLWEGMAKERRKCANVTRQLQILASKIDKVENGQIARDGIDKFAEKLERDLLTDFDNAYRSADLAAMRDSADILADFNGGGSVIQMFVNQHDYFIVQEMLVDRSLLTNEDMWAKISDPDGDSAELENVIEVLVQEIQQVIVTEMEIIKKVFRNTVAILKVFLQRVFGQRIQLQVEDYLTAAEEHSTLAYMRTLHLCYSKIGALTKSLKDVFAQQGIDPQGELTALLDQNFADIFVPFIENGRYFETEVKNLNEIITFTLNQFVQVHSPKLQREHSILSRFTSSSSESNKERLDPSGAISNERSQGRLGQFMKSVRIERSNSQLRPAASVETEERKEASSSITLESIQKVLIYTAESIKRDLELAESTAIPKDAETFLHMLLEGLGRNVADVLLDEAISKSHQDVKNVDLSFLKVVRRVCGFIYLVSSMVQTVIVPMLSSNSALKIHAVKSLNEYLKIEERKMNRITQSAVELCVGRLFFLLAKQKKKDYLLKSEDSHLIGSQSQTCDEVSSFLDDIYSVACEALDGQNFEDFLTEVGLAFKDLLLDHFKKFNVSNTGGLIVSNDIQKYQERIDNWSVSELSERFSILHNIGNLFTAQPDSIQSLIRGSQLAQVKAYIIQEYLQKRLDYFTSGINRKASLSFSFFRFLRFLTLILGFSKLIYRTHCFYSNSYLSNILILAIFYTFFFQNSTL